MDKPVDGAEALAREVLAKEYEQTTGRDAKGDSPRFHAANVRHMGRDDYADWKDRASIRAMLAYSAALVAENERLREALKWALPLAERAVDDHRMLRVQCGHSDITGTYKNGVTWVGIHQFEVDQIEAARTALETRNG